MRLQSDADYRERCRELMALEEIADDGVALMGKARRHAALRPVLELGLEDFAALLQQALNRHIDEALTVRRDALRLYEETRAECGAMDEVPTRQESRPHHLSDRDRACPRLRWAPDAIERTSS